METQDWLMGAAQGLLVALFIAFFWLVIRLWLHLSRSASAYNSVQPAGGSQGSAAGDPDKHKTSIRSGSGE